MNILSRRQVIKIKNIINKRTLSWCTNKFSEPIMKECVATVKANWYFEAGTEWFIWSTPSCLVFFFSGSMKVKINDEFLVKWSPLRLASFAFLSKINESRFHRFLPHTNLRNMPTLPPFLGLQSALRARRFSIGTICTCVVHWVRQTLFCCSFKGRERRLHFIVTAHGCRGSLRSNVILVFWRHPEQA